MRRLTITAFALIALLLAAINTSLAGVSVSIAEPNFYGRIDIGGFPAPRLIYEQPVIVRPVKVWHAPVYLRVPPRHVQQWDRYCGRYEACGRPVYFVDDGWYQEVYVPRYREYRPAPRIYPAPPPVYYEYRRDYRRPAKRVYVREEYYEDHHHHGRGHGHR